MIAPPGFDEGFFQATADLNEAGPPDPTQIAELAAQAGLEAAELDWLADRRGHATRSHVKGLDTA